MLFCTTALGQEPVPRFRSTTNLVIVDVRVLSEDGQPVKGLKAEDFSVAEEGVLQQVSYFREVDLPLTVTEIQREIPVQNELPADSSATVDSAELPYPEKRLLVFLFDLSSAGLQDIVMMGRAADEFLEEQFNDYDSAAVLLVDNGLELLTDFTSDPVVLGRAFSRLTSGDPELDLSVPDEEGDTTSEFVANETEFALFQTNQQLSAIQSVADAFREVPGRKALIYFSSGMNSRGVENDEQMRWTADACNRANMSIYSVDARGLVALSPGGGAHRAGAGGTAIYSGRSSLNQMASLVESQNTLVTLSSDTGGVALVDDNDFSKLLRQAVEESSHYYLLGYYVPESPKDGRFRRIDVRMQVRYGEVVSRQGYYAEKPYWVLSQSERELQFLQAVVDDSPAADLPLAASAEYFPDKTDQYKVAVLLSFDYSALSLIAGTEDLNLEIVILARDREGQARAGVRDKLEIRSREKDEARFVYENLVLLDPGEYRISAYVRDNRTGKMSKTVYPLALPPNRDVRIGSLVLAARWEESVGETSYRIKSGEQLSILENPLRVGGRSLVPRLDASFYSSETVYIHGKVSIRGSNVNPEYRIVLISEIGERLFEGPWKLLASSSGEIFDINARLPLSQLGPGSYRLSAEIRNSGSELLELGRAFTVVPSANGK